MKHVECQNQINITDINKKRRKKNQTSMNYRKSMKHPSQINQHLPKSIKFDKDCIFSNVTMGSHAKRKNRHEARYGQRKATYSNSNDERKSWRKYS